MSELHQTAKRAHHEAISFTLCGVSSSRLLVQLYCQGPAARHRTGARSSTVPSPASLMIDGLTAETQGVGQHHLETLSLQTIH